MSTTQKLMDCNRLQTLLSMVTKTRQWPVQDIECAKQWLSPTRTLALLGDAAHAMIPFMSIGAPQVIFEVGAAC